ncbi:ABC transporter permease [Mangrovicoccus sp. HB161399]|uniref:ABC transporter permease n=1 Tax=Mangrovicoccus sp. HB161399 TaxID=2720392 RepID=UPI001553A3DA|nr:ABC transporter permease [Mangrovicoccus sp. HB161399]
MSTDPMAPSRHALARGIFGGVALFLVWEFVARGFDLPSYILPAVSEIVARIWTARAALGNAAAYTLGESVAGYLLGGAIGVGLALCVTLVPPLRKVIVPAATAVNSVPVVAFSPLILLWFGMGMTSKIVMVAVAVSFTMFVSALAGFDRVDERSVNLMRSFGASRAAILWKLRLPTALPLILSGMRLSTVRSLIVAIVTEMLGAYGGLGWVIYQAVVVIDFVQVWAAIFIASLASLAFFGVVSWLERRLVFWR